MCWQAQIDAVVMDEVLRRPWFWPSLEVGRSSDYCHAHVRPDTHGDHVLGYLLARAHSGVITLGDDIRQSVVGSDFDLDLGVLAQKRLKFRP